MLVVSAEFSLLSVAPTLVYFFESSFFITWAKEKKLIDTRDLRGCKQAGTDMVDKAFWFGARSCKVRDTGQLFYVLQMAALPLRSHMFIHHRRNSGTNCETQTPVVWPVYHAAGRLAVLHFP
jgi:hypothetical protein